MLADRVRMGSGGKGGHTISFTFSRYDLYSDPNNCGYISYRIDGGNWVDIRTESDMVNSVTGSTIEFKSVDIFNTGLPPMYTPYFIVRVNGNVFFETQDITTERFSDILNVESDIVIDFEHYRMQ